MSNFNEGFKQSCADLKVVTISMGEILEIQHKYVEILKILRSGPVLAK